MVAEAWDLLRGDTSAWPDRAFYRTLIDREGGPVLDIGCGTGRLLLDYLAAGLDIDGVDNSPEMLALCREKATGAGLGVDGRLFHQTMEGLDLGRRYRVILVPSSSFQLVLAPTDAAEALTRFHAHLEPGGVLVMSIMSKLWPGRRTPPQMEWFGWRMIGEAARANGAVVRRWIRTRYDHDAQLEHEENRYELLRDGAVVHEELHQRSPNVRWYTQEQTVSLCRAAGFADVRLTSGFTLDPARPEDTTFCVIARRG
jgi:SAM-dependent methyltransferase